MGTGNGRVNGDSERFENWRIRQALERARRLHIRVDGLDPFDLEAEGGSGTRLPERPEGAATAPAAGLVPVDRRGEGPRPPRVADRTAVSPNGGSLRGRDRTAPPLHDGWLRRSPTGENSGATVAAQDAEPRSTATGDVADRGRLRPGWWRWLEAALPDLVAAAVATGALVAPWFWLTVIAGFGLGVGVLVAGSAGVSVAGLPLHGLRRLGSLMHPRSLLWTPVIAVRTVLLAVIVPGVVAGAAWMLDEGAVGAPAAARAGAWTHGLRVVAALMCFMLIRGVGPGRAHRAASIRSVTSRLANGALLATAAASVVVMGVVVAAGPRLEGERFSGADGLGWLPPPLRPAANGMRDRIVTSELDAVATCLTGRQSSGWNRSYTTANHPGDLDVAGLVLARGGPDSGDIATAVAAAHNQLAPWVETIEVSWAGITLVQVDRRQLPRDRPLTDGSRLLAAASTGRSLLVDGARHLDRRTVLHCSAGPVL